MDDATLLREYVTNNSEAAFEALVSRYLHFVHSAAMRQVHDSQMAEEVAQVVFIILAQKAARICDRTILSGWLFKTTRFVALAQTRAATRRRQYEQKLHMQSEDQFNTPDQPIWEQISPLLDEALAKLGEKDRQAVLLRFFQNKSLAEVGNAFGTGEDAARMRINRTLAKLNRFFNRHGISSTTAILAGVISANSVQAAPVALAKVATAVALAKGATASGSTLTLIKGALKVMAWTKVNTAIVVGVVVILAAGTTTTLVVKHQSDSKQSPNRIGTNPGDFAPDKLAFMEHMKSIKATVIPAFIQYAAAHQDEIPKSMSDLQPYLPPNTTGMDDDHWEILASGKLTPQLTLKDIVLFQQKNVPSGQYANLKIIGYTDGHLTARK